jgi:hypothetical protein
MSKKKKNHLTWQKWFLSWFFFFVFEVEWHFVIRSNIKKQSLKYFTLSSSITKLKKWFASKKKKKKKKGKFGDGDWRHMQHFSSYEKLRMIYSKIFNHKFLNFLCAFFKEALTCKKWIELESGYSNYLVYCIRFWSLKNYSANRKHGVEHTHTHYGVIM